MATNALSLLHEKIVVFGATGPTGRALVIKALMLGHKVTAVVRNLDKFELTHQNLDCIQGDALDPDTFTSAITGKDAVLSCIGAHGTSLFKHTTLYTDTMKAIKTGMEKTGIKRIVTITTWGTKSVPGSPMLLEWVLKPFVMKGFIHDMEAMEDMLIASPLQFTVVRPPELTRAKGNGNYEVKEGQFLENTKWSIPREDVADFMLKTLQTNEYNRKCVAIASRQISAVQQTN